VSTPPGKSLKLGCDDVEGLLAESDLHVSPMRLMAVRAGLPAFSFYAHPRRVLRGVSSRSEWPTMTLVRHYLCDHSDEMFHL